MTKKLTSIFGGREVEEETDVNKLAEIIADTFKSFAAPIEIVEAIDGYSSYHFHIRPKQPMRMKAFAGFLEDLKYALSNDSVEIQAPLPNKKLVGITVQKRQELRPIYFDEALEWSSFKESKSMVVPLGIDEFGDQHLLDITRTPHMLMGGTTGSGKSMLLHTIINALLEKNSPDSLRFIFLDPKRVELTMYNKIPHLLTPVITNAKKTIQALSWAVKEMERRYDILEAESCQNISSYHEKVYEPAIADWKKRGSRESHRLNLPESLPYIVIVVDELNDFMQSYPREFEACVVRLAQMARAVGIHMILATQRPSTSVITGTIKANIPARIAMMVASQVDSRTIIDTTGAEKLRGSGDILYLGSDSPKPVRLQSLFISEEEILDRVKEL
jgi:S-DNA-T family DNA segregation ATPase FtsK/SpoIIIE